MLRCVRIYIPMALFFDCVYKGENKRKERLFAMSSWIQKMLQRITCFENWKCLSRMRSVYLCFCSQSHFLTKFVGPHSSTRHLGCSSCVTGCSRLHCSRFLSDEKEVDMRLRKSESLQPAEVILIETPRG